MPNIDIKQGKYRVIDRTAGVELSAHNNLPNALQEWTRYKLVRPNAEIVIEQPDVYGDFDIDDLLTQQYDQGYTEGYIDGAAGQITPPVEQSGITVVLNGPSEITIDVGAGETYTELGARVATDVGPPFNWKDLDITVTGEVDETTEGVYEIVYTATDDLGNTASEVRTVPVINVPGISIVPLPSGPNVIWETNFASDADFSHNVDGGIETITVPNGWDGVRTAGTTSSIVTQNTGGIGGSKAMRLTYEPSIAQPNVNLFKHLTGSAATGYDDLYIRYNVKFPNAFRVGDPAASPVNTAPFWKWGRLWQNTHPTDPVDATGPWTEQRANSYYVVWNFGGSNPTVYGIWNAASFSANSGSNLHLGSSGGERYHFHYSNQSFATHADEAADPGPYFASMPGWELDFDGTAEGDFLNTSTQDWHTIEFHFKLASSDGANDGKFEIWYDGVLQADPETIVENLSGAPALSGAQGPPTIHQTSGWNMFSCFDNMSGWDDDWDTVGVDGYIDLNDICVSTSRIGHSYVVTGDGS